jgi:hypothetical protein
MRTAVDQFMNHANRKNKNMTNLLHDLDCKIDEWFLAIVPEQHAHLDFEDVTEKNAQEFLRHLILYDGRGPTPIFFHYLTALYDSTGAASAVYNSLTIKHAVLMMNEITDHWNSEYSCIERNPSKHLSEKEIIHRYLEVYLHNKFLCGCNNLVDCVYDTLLSHCPPPYKKTYKEKILWKQLMDLKDFALLQKDLGIEDKSVMAEKEEKLMKELRDIVKEGDVVSQLINAKMDMALLQSANLKLTADIKSATKMSDI